MIDCLPTFALPRSCVKSGAFPFAEFSAIAPRQDPQQERASPKELTRSNSHPRPRFGHAVRLHQQENPGKEPLVVRQYIKELP